MEINFIIIVWEYSLFISVFVAFVRFNRLLVKLTIIDQNFFTWRNGGPQGPWALGRRPTCMATTALHVPRQKSLES